MDKRKGKFQDEKRCWKTIDSSKLLDASPWLELWSETVSLPDGRVIQDYYRIEQPDFVGVFAMDDTNQVMCVQHYKHGPRDICLGLPAGYVKGNEPPLDAARRELLEETGCVAESWNYLGSFSVDGNRGCGRAHFYLARSICRIQDPDPDDLEEISIEYLSLSELAEYLYVGRVKTLGAAAGIALGLFQVQRCL